MKIGAGVGVHHPHDRQTLSKARAPTQAREEFLAKARSQALNVLGWSGADDPLEWAKEARRLADERIDVLQAELGVHAAAIAEAEIQTEKLIAALNEKLAALDVADAHISSLKSGSDEAHAALATLGWDGNSYPADWAKTTAAHYKAVREALGVPADKPIIPYAQHAAKGMQALAILGWQDTHPVEWATKRAAAEADLRGAFAEAELVGNDHAAMVRQMLGNLRGKSEQATSALMALKQMSGRIDLAEKRVEHFRAWLLGMCPQPPRDKFGTIIAPLTDDALIASATARANDVAIQLDQQQHTIDEFTRELKAANDRRMQDFAARRGEIAAFSEALHTGFDWPLGWSPNDPSSPIAIFREVLAEVRRRAGVKLSP